MGWSGCVAVKYFKKNPAWSKAEGTISQNEKSSYRNIQYLYLLSKGLRNLFPGLLERPKCQIAFSGTKHSGDIMEVLSVLVIYLFNRGELHFVLKMC